MRILLRQHRVIVGDSDTVLLQSFFTAQDTSATLASSAVPVRTIPVRPKRRLAFHLFTQPTTHESRWWTRPTTRANLTASGAKGRLAGDVFLYPVEDPRTVSASKLDHGRHCSPRFLRESTIQARPCQPLTGATWTVVRVSAGQSRALRPLCDTLASRAQLRGPARS